MKFPVKDKLAMVRGLTLLALAYLLSVPGVYAQAPGEVGNAAQTEQAMAWLERLGPALNMTSYQGVFVYARGDQVHSMRIAHRFRDGRVEERLVMQAVAVARLSEEV
jgi:sigma-E factor negative regulatory protein RseB